MEPQAHTTPWYGMPFVALWRLASAAERRLGIVRSLLIGAALATLGLLFCLTFVGVLVGLPLFIFGVTLFLRALI